MPPLSLHHASTSISQGCGRIWKQAYPNSRYGSAQVARQRGTRWTELPEHEKHLSRASGAVRQYLVRKKSRHAPRPKDVATRRLNTWTKGDFTRQRHGVPLGSPAWCLWELKATLKKVFEVSLKDDDRHSNGMTIDSDAGQAAGRADLRKL